VASPTEQLLQQILEELRVIRALLENPIVTVDPRPLPKRPGSGRL
jgi:hypothetical protein